MIKVTERGRIETPEKKLLRSTAKVLRPKRKVIVPEKHLEGDAISKGEAAALRAALSGSESRAELRHVIDRETAQRQAAETKSKAKVDKYEKPSDNRPAMGLLHEYFNERNVPVSKRPELTAKFELLAAEAAGRAETAPKLSEAELAAFKAHAAANQWNPESEPKVSASAFIKETFKDWLGRGLTRKHIFDAQENLAGAYSTEVSRDPRKRIEGLIASREKLPVGAPRPPSIRPVAELSEKEKAERREKKTAAQRRWRKKQHGEALRPSL